MDNCICNVFSISFSYVSALQQKLSEVYPHVTVLNTTTRVEDIYHLFFKDINYFVEYTPLMVAYVALFLYLYFSVRKWFLIVF